MRHSMFMGCQQLLLELWVTGINHLNRPALRISKLNQANCRKLLLERIRDKHRHHIMLAVDITQGWKIACINKVREHKQH